MSKAFPPIFTRGKDELRLGDGWAWEVEDNAFSAVLNSATESICKD